MLQVQTFHYGGKSSQDERVVKFVNDEVNTFLRKNNIQRNELVSLTPTACTYSGSLEIFLFSITLVIDRQEVIFAQSDDDVKANTSSVNIEANLDEAEKYWK